MVATTILKIPQKNVSVKGIGTDLKIRRGMFKDARGQGVYNVFPSIPEGQVNISTTYPGVIRAFHRHWYQEDNWYIVSGQFEVVLAEEYSIPLFDENGQRDEDVKVHYLGPGESISIPRLVWHGFKVLGTEPGTLLYYVTKKFDADDPDEERAIWNRFYDWEVEYK